jgi:hypothetical protein
MRIVGFDNPNLLLVCWGATAYPMNFYIYGVNLWKIGGKNRSFLCYFCEALIPFAGEALLTTPKMSPL